MRAAARGDRALRARSNTPERDQGATEPETDRLTDYIKRVVDRAPPLSTEQRDRVAVLLRGVGGSR